MAEMPTFASVKNLLRGTVFLLLLLSFGSTVITQSRYAIKPQEIANTSPADELNAGSSLLNHAAQVSDAVHIPGVIGNQRSKDKPVRLPAIATGIERRLNAEFFQYLHLTACFLILYRKANRLFPYHTFW